MCTLHCESDASQPACGTARSTWPFSVSSRLRIAGGELLIKRRQDAWKTCRISAFTCASRIRDGAPNENACEWLTHAIDSHAMLGAVLVLVANERECVMRSTLQHQRPTVDLALPRENTGVSVILTLPGAPATLLPRDCPISAPNGE
jgi:hypothetical protein